ncbi:MAG: protein kinase [Bdellovibrionales bacterium]|nr:protein kinase [Bdellovibrionales bacterium]
MDKLDKQNQSAAARRLGDEPLVGAVLDGKYEIERILGHGGMGVVYQARHTLMGRRVAIKVLHPHLYNSENEEYYQRFRREAQIACRLTSPHTITLFDFGFDEDSPYLVMEFVEGRTLKAVLLEEGPLSLERANLFLQQISHALSEAHSLGIIHRDLKPDNLMICKRSDGTEVVRILDFGIAKPMGLFGDEPSTELTRAGAFMGTPKYMSPEQAQEGAIDHRSDLYSIGVILYQMLTGDVPFDSTSPLELLFQHMNRRPTPMWQFKPELQIPKPVSDIVMKALEKRPEDRYAQIADLAADFDLAVRNSGRSQGSGKRLSAYMLAAIAILASAAGIGYWQLAQDTTRSSRPVESPAAPTNDELADANLPSSPELIEAHPLAVESQSEPQAEPTESDAEIAPVVKSSELQFGPITADDTETPFVAFSPEDAELFASLGQGEDQLSSPADSQVSEVTAAQVPEESPEEEQLSPAEARKRAGELYEEGKEFLDKND